MGLRRNCVEPGWRTWCIVGLVPTIIVLKLYHSSVVTDTTNRSVGINHLHELPEICTYEERHRNMLHACANRVIDGDSDRVLPNLLVDHDNRIAYCVINKVASTSLRKLLVLIKGQTKL